MKQSMYGPKIQDELSSSSSPSPSSSWWWISLFLFYNNRPTRDCNLELQRLNRLCLRANFFWHGSQLCVLQEGVSNLACLQRYTMKLVFAFRPLLFDVEKGACFLVFEPPFSTTKTSFVFRLRPIGRRTLCRKAKTLFGFWFSTSRLDRPKVDETEYVESESENIPGFDAPQGMA